MLWSVGRRTVGANRKANVISAYYGCFHFNRKRGYLIPAGRDAEACQLLNQKCEGINFLTSRTVF